MMKNLFLLSILLVLFSCSTDNNSSSSEKIDESIKEGAQLFNLEEVDSCIHILELLNIDGSISKSFVLNGTNEPIENTEIPVIEVPISRVACQSTTHLSFFDFLDRLDAVKGVSYASMIQNEKVLDKLEKGELINLTTSDEIDFELLISIDPDVLLVYPYGEQNYSKIESSGIPCIPITEYMEVTPLAQAEWVKLMGVLLGERETAEEKFDLLKDNYQSAKDNVNEIIKNGKERPLVFTGSFWQGNWKAPSGKSLIARYIEDAGGEYAFDEYQKEGNIELDFEEFFVKAIDCDFFGKVLYEDSLVTIQKLIGDDSRLEELKAFKENQLFYCNASKVDYFGSAIMRPDEVLKDLAHILHPELNQAYSPTYFFSINE